MRVEKKNGVVRFIVAYDGFCEKVSRTVRREAKKNTETQLVDIQQGAETEISKLSRSNQHHPMRVEKENVVVRFIVA